ncbi:hypothetical protein [Hippea sp. KM1]|uniref:hypothetical protein n=1 Tax=Hippea sp. KM1 TaxID=944481 RepID=UPI00046D457A|nr:hypothetical protein [Hippea sp. KM1]
MKKGLVAVVIGLVVAISIIGYFFANTYAQKRAKAEVESFLKEANLEGDVNYKTLKANIFSKSVKLEGVQWDIQNTKQTVGELNIKTLTISGNPKESFTVKMENIELINLNSDSPTELIGKPLFEAKNGYWDVKRSDGNMDIRFSLDDIKLNKMLINSLVKEEKQAKEIMTKVLRLDNPIYIKAHYIINKDKGILNIDKYQIDFKNNLKVSYSFYVTNIDYQGFENVAKQLRSNKGDPLMVLSLLSKLYTMKPINLSFSITNEGVVDRALDFIKKETNTSKDQLRQQLSASLNNTPFLGYEKPIENFITSDSDKITITIENPRKLSVADLITTLKTQPVLKVFKVDISN